jgi:hypothetical protein
MKRSLPILALVCLGWLSALSLAVAQNSSAPPKASPGTPPPETSHPQTSAQPAGAVTLDKQAQADDQKARGIVQKAIEALGGQLYLTVRSRETQGRSYGFHHGRPTSAGVLFWSFAEFPDKERAEFTKERDVARVYAGAKAWEITYKGAKPLDPKDLEDYLRLRRYSLETILRTWVNDPGVIFLYQGNAIAAQHEAYRITVINAKDESVDLFFDTESHLPVKKSFEWRDPVDRQKNVEEEIYENYRDAGGVMVPYNTTRYFNGDMAAERFLNAASINGTLDETMFDPNSGYNPNKQPPKAKKK